MQKSSGSEVRNTCMEVRGRYGEEVHKQNNEGGPVHIEFYANNDTCSV